MFLAGTTMYEAAVEICDKIRTTPIQLRRNGGHEGSEESSSEQSAPCGGKMINRDEHVAGFGMLEARIEDDDGKRGENPRPGAQRVVREVEPQHREQAVALVAGAQNALRDVAAAARFRARIPEGPPLHAEIDAKRDDGQSPKRLAREAVREIGEET